MKKSLMSISLVLLLSVCNKSSNCQNASFFKEQDCFNLTKSINNKTRKDIEYTAESYMKDVVAPCFASSIIDVMERNNIYSLEDGRYEQIASEARECFLNSLNDSDEKSSNLALLNIFLELFKSAFNSSSNNQAQNNNDNYSSNNSSTKSAKPCYKCKPYDNKGWYITDYSAYNKTYINGRYILRPGYRPCQVCKGTGDCRAYGCSGGKRECPGSCLDNGTCAMCHGDRFEICSQCKGTGFNR